MLRVQGTSRPAVNYGITIHQHGACSCIAELFSRAIKWVKELFSCGKKPIVLARPVELIPVPPQLQPVLIERALPQVQPEPARLAVPVERPLEQAAPVLPPIVQRDLPRALREPIDLLDIEQANEQIAGFNDWLERKRADFLEQLRLEPENRNVDWMDRCELDLQTSDARLVALRDRLAILLAVSLPPDLAEGLPNWNRIQADRVIGCCEEYIRDLIIRLGRGEDIPDGRYNLNNFQAVLHAVRVKRAALQQEPAPPAAAPIEPQIAQVPLLPHDQNFFDRLDLRVVNNELADFDRILVAEREKYRGQMILPPDQRNRPEFAACHRYLETADASLAALQVRKAQLQAAILPPYFAENLQHMHILEVRARRAALLHRQGDLQWRVLELNGRARRLEHIKLDQHYAQQRLYQKRLAELNPGEAQ